MDPTSSEPNREEPINSASTQLSQSAVDQQQQQHPITSQDENADGDVVMHESQSGSSQHQEGEDGDQSIQSVDIQTDSQSASQHAIGNGGVGNGNGNSTQEVDLDSSSGNADQPVAPQGQAAVSSDQAESVLDNQVDNSHASLSSNDDAMQLDSNESRDEISTSTSDGQELGERSQGGPSNPSTSTTSNPTSTSTSDSDPQAPGAFPSPPNPNSTQNSTPRTQFFRLPYLHPDGSPALLEFTSAPLPSMPPGSPPYTPTRPMFVPRGASPLPFGFIFDPNSNTAWSIVEVPPSTSSTTGGNQSSTSSTSSTSTSENEPSTSTTNPAPAAATPSNPTTSSNNDPPTGQDGIRNIAFVNQTFSSDSTTNTYRINPANPRLISGPAFHVMIDFTFGGAGGGSQIVEELDPKRAEKFCQNLEKADSELRERMLRVGLGELGIYGNNNDVGKGNALGCAVCLEQYMDDDRPAWLDSSSAEVKASDSEVVCVPCEGHHTLHRGCLKDWLSNTKPSKWACPFCRGILIDGEKVPTGLKNAKERLEAEKKLKETRSLREEVRFRERRNGWLCDSRTCIGCYPESTSTNAVDDQSSSNIEAPSKVNVEMKLLTLKPCKHEIHLDCLLTELRVHDGLLDYHEDEEDEEEEEEEDQEVEMKEDEKEEDGHKLSLSEIEVERLTGTHQDHKQEDIIMSNPEPKSIEKQTPNDSGIEIEPKDKEEGFSIVYKGRWIDCPCCRKSCWAELPMKKKIKSKKIA